MSSEKPVLIEQSSKRSKAFRAAGLGLLVLAVLAAAVMSDKYGPTDTGYIVAVILGLAGAVCFAYGTAVAWWNHG